MNKRDEYIRNRVMEHYNFLIQNYDYEVIYIGLQGSQNYELDVYDDEYTSDVDTKAIVLPSFEDFVYNRKPVSTTIILPNNEHIDVKDIRVMFDTFKKQNVNFIEILFTDYYFVADEYKEYIEELLKNAELIAHLNYNQALKCMAGMSMEKLKALQHPYPTIIDKIKKYGYDPKQLHHILRMNDFIKKYVSGLSYKDCLIPNDKDALIDVKKGILSCEEAVKIAKFTDEDTHNIAKENLIEGNDIPNQEAIDFLDELKFKILTKKFKKDLLEGIKIMSEADMMFEKLGYKKYIDDSTTIRYYNKKKNIEYKFLLDKNCYTIARPNKPVCSIKKPTKREQLAINKKIEELKCSTI